MSDFYTTLGPGALCAAPLFALLLCGLAKVLHDVCTSRRSDAARPGRVRSVIGNKPNGARYQLRFFQNIEEVMNLTKFEWYRAGKAVISNLVVSVKEEFQYSVAVFRKCVAWACSLAEICQLLVKLLIVVLQHKAACLRLARAEKRIVALGLDQVDLRAQYLANLAVGDSVAERLEPVGYFNGHRAVGVELKANVKDQRTPGA